MFYSQGYLAISLDKVLAQSCDSLHFCLKNHISRFPSNVPAPPLTIHNSVHCSDRTISQATILQILQSYYNYDNIIIHNIDNTQQKYFLQIIFLVSTFPLIVPSAPSLSSPLFVMFLWRTNQLCPKTTGRLGSEAMDTCIATHSLGRDCSDICHVFRYLHTYYVFRYFVFRYLPTLEFQVPMGSHTKNITQTHTPTHTLAF